MSKQIRISFRTDAAFKERCRLAADKVKLDESVIEAAAVEAVIEHIEQYGQITIPVRLEAPTPSKIFKYPEPAEAELQRAAESPSGEKAAKTSERQSIRYSKSARRAKSQ